MHKVLISLAANCDQKQNLNEARLRLGHVLSSFSFTPELWTEPEGALLRHDRYLNQLVAGDTALTTDELCRQLKAIEELMGRTDADRSQGIVRIDLDLLLYDSERHHLKDWERCYVKQLLPLLPVGSV